jgi:RNA polymerase sigma factor (sigma-70 family)
MGKTNDTHAPRAPRGGPPPGRRRFATTRWGVVLAAGGHAPSAESARALAELCAEYWYPLYTYVRRRGHAPEDAQDLTQAFFARLLEKKSLAAADPLRGRFRTFLLTSLQNFLASEWRRASAAKRGGGLEILSIDFPSAEERYRLDPSRDLSPEAAYERRWALGVLDTVLAAVRAEHERAGRLELFEALKDRLAGSGEASAYAELSERLGQSEQALRQAASRMRRRFRDRLRAEIAETVTNEQDVDDELRHLLAALTGPAGPGVTSDAGPRTSQVKAPPGGGS